MSDQSLLDLRHLDTPSSNCFLEVQSLATMQEKAHDSQSAMICLIGYSHLAGIAPFPKGGANTLGFTLILVISFR